MRRAGAIATLAALVAGCATLPPPLPDGVPAIEAARYICTDGLAFTALFDREGMTATLTFEGGVRDDPDAYVQDRGFRVALATQRPASGIWYAASGWSLRGKGIDAVLTRPDGRTSACRAADEVATADDRSI